MCYRHLFEIVSDKSYMIKGIRETDIRDEYLPAPIVTIRSSKAPFRTRPVPLSRHRLVRREHN